MKNNPPIYTKVKKLSNIPEKSMIHHNRKKMHELTIKCQHDYDVTTLSLNIAIKTSKQPITFKIIYHCENFQAFMSVALI